MRNLSIILILILTSCGSRKSEVNIQKEEREKITAIDVKSQSVIETNKYLRINADISELNINPVDTSKQIDIITPDGRKYSFKNAKISHKKDNSITQEKTTIKQTENTAIKSQITESQKTYSKEKKTDRDNTLFWVIVSLGSFLILFIIFRLVKNKTESIV